MLALEALKIVQSEVPLDIARSLFMLGQAFPKNGPHETANIILKACFDLGKAENAEFSFYYMC